MRGPRRRQGGFTVVELIVTISILGIMATLVLPSLGSIRERAERVVCAGHLRSLHCSLGAYLNDNEQWPQCDDELSDTDREQFWLDTLKDYGAPEKVWQCPTMARSLASESNASSSGIKKIHYEPTAFDDNPMTPRRWSRMPWLVEKGDMHHGGALMIRADGAVQTVNEAISQIGN